MPTTAGGIRYPASSASINIPGDLQNLAEDVETYITANAVTTTGTFTLTNKTIGSTGLFFEGSTANDFETLVTVVDPTADNTITLPNATGTVVLADGSGNVTVSGNLTVSGTTTTVNSTEINVQNALTFEGLTANSFETTLTVVDPTADRTITFPDATGTVAMQADLTNLEIAVIMAAF